MTNIITISGKARAGKDTTALFIKHFLQNNNKNAAIIHYADLLKMICKTCFDWNGKKNAYGRHLLQYIGTDIVRKNNPDFWVNIMEGIVVNVLSDIFDYIIIPDARFTNEIDRWKEINSDFYTFEAAIHVARENNPLELQDNAAKHISENALKDYEFDVYIVANTLEELKDKVEKLLIHRGIIECSE